MAATNEAAMTFLDHLEELRRRIIWSGIAVVAFTFISLSFSQLVMRLLLYPLKTPINTLLANVLDALARPLGSIVSLLSVGLRARGISVNAEIIKGGVVEGIMAYLKISITCGAVLASPIILYQVWAFVFPALTHREKKFALPLFLIIVFFFLAGSLFAYFVVAPVIVEFSARIYPQFANLWELEKHVNFLTRLLLGFGIAFELPVVMAFLSRIGVINAQGFRERQSYAVVAIFVISALLTPADVLSMMLMALPLILLYQLGIFFAFLLEQEPESYA